MRNKQFESVFGLPVNYLMKPQEEITAQFNGTDAGLEDKDRSAFRLRLIGEVDLYPMWRNEGDFPRLYELIDDALNNNVVHHSTWSLEVKSPADSFPISNGSGGNYPMAAWYKVRGGRENTRPFYSFLHIKDDLRFSIWYKKENVRLLDEGNLCFTVEIYYKETAKYPEDIIRKPDAAFTLDLGEGSSDWQKGEMTVQAKKEIDFILVYFKGDGFTGNLWLEDPFLGEDPELNLLPAFAPANSFITGFNWLGLNFSRKEWPEFDISLNGSSIFRGGMFQRIYRWPASEIELPEELIVPGDNILNVRYISGYREAIPYRLKRLEILRTEFGAVNIISCPEVVGEGEIFTILISTKNDNTTVTYKCGKDNIVPLDREMTYGKAGLHTAKFKALEAGPGTSITAFASFAECKVKNDSTVRDGCTVKDGRKVNAETAAQVDRIVRRQEDGVLTGTGDAVYVGQNDKEMEYFLSWFLHNNIGNAVVFRPVYRWGGSRTLNRDMWKRIAGLCSEMQLYYANMIDGRELPGCNANPTAEELQGEFYMGSQAHEKDGNYYYWGRREVYPNEELYLDIWGKLADPAGLFPTTQYYKRKGFIFRFLDPYEADDMKEGAENFVKRLALNSLHAPRHTGPSVLFRYFYQAGFDWLGAELMYGPHEVIISALRGASLSCGKKNYGSHIAIQWSTTPHDTPQKYRRYFLSLFTCYVQGVSHINTEEGLWRLEEGYVDHERFDTPCIKLRDIHQKFYRYIRTHSRRGEIYIPAAFIQGRYDGWSCFGRKNVWMQEGEEWKFSHPEESWDLLKVFYPLSHIDSIYRHPCPDEPVGFFTGTPYGSTDIIPAEAGTDNLGRYKYLIFLGWNSAEPGQIDKLLDYVEKGGTLILGLPHLYAETKRSSAFGENPCILDTPKLAELLGFTIKGLQDAVTEDGTRVKAGKIIIDRAEVLEKDCSGIPILLENRHGSGKAIFVNIKAYPAEKPVRKLYERLLHQTGNEIIDSEKKKGWLKCSDTISFTAYDLMGISGINRVIYFINVNWWDEQENGANAELMWGERQIALKIDRDMLHTLVLSDNYAVWIHDFETEVLEMAETEDGVLITIQGAGDTEITVISRKETGMRNLKTHMNGVKTLSFSNKE